MAETTPPSALSIAPEGVHSCTSASPLHANEDRSLVMDDVLLCPSHPASIYAVFDGHAGSTSSTFLRENLHKLIFDAPLLEKHAREPITEEELCEAINRGFSKAEKQLVALLREKNDYSGAVCNLVILYDGKIFCVNLGDCRAVLSRSRSATGPATNSFPLSKDHRPGRERQRIMDAGGWISDDGRINGVLMCSRAFGDREFKYEEDKEGGLKFLATMREKRGRRHSRSRPFVCAPRIVLAEPEIKVLERSEMDGYIIVASDGVWDSISSKRIVTLTNSLLKKNSSFEHVAERIVNEVRSKGGEDDVTMIYLWFRSIEQLTGK